MVGIEAQLISHQKQMLSLKESYVQNRLPASWLFVGPSGIGKSLVVKAYLQWVFCENKTTENKACGECSPCLQVKNLQHSGLLWVEPEGVSIKISQSRKIIDFLSLKRVTQKRFVVIDEAHNLNPQAANALLKVVEEPPEESHFILLSPSMMGVLPTLRSRSQVMRFQTLSAEDMGRLFPDEKKWLLQAAQGRAERVDQLNSMGELRDVAFQAWEEFTQKSSHKAFDFVYPHIKADKEKSLVISELWIQFLRDSYFHKNKLQPVIHQDQKGRLKMMSHYSDAFLLSMMKQSFQLRQDLLAHIDRSLAYEHYWLEAEKRT